MAVVNERFAEVGKGIGYSIWLEFHLSAKIMDHAPYLPLLLVSRSGP